MTASSTSVSASTVVVSGEAIAAYGFNGGHPFGTDRHEAFMREFAASGLDRRVRSLQPRTATNAELGSFHTQRYIDFVRERCAAGAGFLDGGDTPAQRGLYESSCAVVGASLVAAEALMRGDARRGFVPIAGLHHAARDAAAGFCVFNDIGVAIEQLRAKHGVKR